MTKKYFLYVVAILFILTGCGGQQGMSRLVEIDSLVSKDMYDSAYQEILKYKKNFGHNIKPQVYYYLLLTQTSLLTNHPLTSDSMINISIAYYKKNQNDEKLSTAYYYKAEYLLQCKKYAQAIILCKKAYDLAHKINNYELQYKAAKLISYINCINGNYDLQLEYAKKTLEYAINTKKDRWIACAYNDMNEAYQYLGIIDSATIYAEKTIPYLNSVDQDDLPYFLNSIGYVYIMKDSQKAKELFKKSLSLKPLSRTLENLAYIYKKEGNEEKAYELWKNALFCDDDIPVDKIIYHILQYNLSNNNLDSACEQLHRLSTIKDSLRTVLADRSIQQIQQKYDEKVVSDRHEKEILKWSIAILLLVIIVISLIGYMKYKKYRLKLIINGYLNEIRRISECNNNAEKQIGELRSRVSEYVEQISKLNQADNTSKLESSFLKETIEKYTEQINKLQIEHKEAEQQIADLNQKIKDLMNQESPRLAKGKLLYDQIMQNGTTVVWTNDDYKCFIGYYKAINFVSYTKVMKKYSPKTVHNTFFLLLYEMGKEDKDIRQIMGITQEAIRSTRFRIQKHLNKH